MLVRLGFLVAASVATYAIKQVSFSRPLPAKNTDDEASRNNEENIKKQVEKEEEEEEEVKRINVINSAAPSGSLIEDDELLPEIESLLTGEIDVPMTNEYRVDAGELERLRRLVKELEEREVKLEGELLEYYGLKEQESDVADLQRQLKIKMVEVDMLNVTITSLQAERKKLQEEAALAAVARRELEAARGKIKELQRQIQVEAGQTKGQLLLLKQQVAELHEKEAALAARDAEVEKKLKGFKEVEVELVELRRKNKELQHEKRALVVKLDAAESRANALSSMSESEMVAQAREEISKLRHANEDLTKQVEGLQMNRFSEVEELVYLRWVNACLRYELRNQQAPSGKLSAARDLSKSLSPRSQQRAKQLMLEYAGSERGGGPGDTDLESASSIPSSPGSEHDADNASVDSFSSRLSNVGRKPSGGLIQKFKKWGGKSSKDDSSLSPSVMSPTRSPMRMSMSTHRPKGPLESLMLRNAGEGIAITSFGKRENDGNDFLDEANLPSIVTRSPSGGQEPMDSVAAFQLMSRSVEGVADDKYPAFKDRHKLATERERSIKAKAEQARAQRFGGGAGLAAVKAPHLPPKLAQIKEKATPSSTGEAEVSTDSKSDSPVVSKIKLSHVEKREPRVPRPPPRSTASAGSNTPASLSTPAPRPPGLPPPPPPPPGPGGPPPPPPPPGAPRGPGSGGDKVHRAPEIVEFYQTLMKREAKKDLPSPGSKSSNTADIRSNMIGEIENRSAFLLAVKADVETQGDFVESLATEVRAASFTTIDDVVSFVNWLDEELSFLVDERAVLKHFEWPESKCDALREAAFEYQDLMKLEQQVSSFADDPKLPCEPVLQKMYTLLEKVEQSVYALLRTRDMAMSRYREFGIPVDWLSDSGVVGKIKLASIQLAKKYMKRVAAELDAASGGEKEVPNRDFLLLQGVRFAFRVHQFAGGFDAESMQAFEQLRSRMNSQTSSAAAAAAAPQA